MRVSIALPTDRVDAADRFVTGDAVGEMAAAAEEAGYEACFVTDHPAPDARWLAAGGHHALDPMVALSFAAAATTSLRLQTHIMVLPYRNPLLTAKSVLSLDVLSGGRVILGVAPGYLKPEFSAMGVDFDERNELTDEAIDVMRLVWSEDEVAYEGRRFRTRGTTMRPRPASKPHPPIWVGGNSRAAIRRAVERGQGWVPFPNPPAAARAVRTPTLSSVDELGERIDYARAHATEVGRTDPLDVCCAPFGLDWSASGGLDVEGVVAELRKMADLGVTWTTVGVPGPDRPSWIANARRFATDVVDALS